MVVRFGTERLTACIALSATLHGALAGVAGYVDRSGYFPQPPARIDVLLRSPQNLPALPVVVGSDQVDGATEGGALSSASLPASKPVLGGSELEALGNGASPGVAGVPGPQAQPEVVEEEPRYLRPNELTDRAVPRALYVFPFPEGDFSGLRGKVVLSIYVSETGNVDRVTVDDTDLPEPFAVSAQQVGMSALFFPARRNGVPAKALVRLEVEYAQ